MKTPQLIRWSIAMAAAEFATNERTVRNRLNKAGTLPGDDGMYSTLQIHAAICEHDRNVMRKGAADAASAELALDERRGKMVDAEVFRKIGDRMVSGFVQTIRAAANLEDEDKEKLLNHLRELGESLVLSGNTEPTHGGQRGRIGE